MVEIQEDPLDAPIEEGKKGYALVHSCEDIFIKRDSDAADQKKPCK